MSALRVLWNWLAISGVPGLLPHPCVPPPTVAAVPGRPVGSTLLARECATSQFHKSLSSDFLQMFKKLWNCYESFELNCFCEFLIDFEPLWWLLVDLSLQTMLGGPIPIKFHQITSSETLFQKSLSAKFPIPIGSRRFPEVSRNSTNSIAFQA